MATILKLFENKITVTSPASESISDAFWEEHEDAFDDINTIILDTMQELGGQIKARLAEIGVEIEYTVD